ncbi:MAG TPA: MmgE/PrpD family protein [Candidatus Acidoferrales bacterium]|nr:MmgE/PrpD family protein [Candidatus Acidoferrales bacterium]
MPAALVTEKIAEWLCSVGYEQLPAEVRHKTADVILDSVGCMVACSGLPEVRAIVEFVQELSDRPECTIVGHQGRSSVVGAAMANGGMAHGDEVDPVHLSSSGGHVAAGTVPTALTVGEWVGASGTDVLRAVALGYELGGRLITILYRERDYVARRFYHTAVAGALTSAATAALLLGFDPGSLQKALGLAAYQASGPDNMTKDPGHMGKTFQVAAANRNGVTAALLARKRCYVTPDILDGQFGFFDAFLGSPEVANELTQGLGDYYAITDVMHKRYPVGSPNQTYLQGLFAILSEQKIQAEDIREIEIQIPKRSVHRIPTTRHASISGEVVCAIAAVHGKLDFFALHDGGAAQAPAVQQMRERIRFVGRDDWQDLTHGRHAIIRLTTRGGRAFEKEVWLEPMTSEELEKKFSGLVSPKWGDEKTHRLKRQIRELEKAGSVRPLLRELQG